MTPRWYLIVCHVVVALLFLGAAVWHVLSAELIRWEFVVLLAAGSLPFSLPLLGMYVKGIGKDGITFQLPIPPDLRALQEAPQSEVPQFDEAVARKQVALLPDWTKDRAQEYERVRGYMLAHVYKRSRSSGQEFSIFIFLVQHKKGTSGPPRRNFEEIEKLEFFFGDSWTNQVFNVVNTGGVLGVRTEAWGTFLATCRISFRDQNRAPIVIYRYIDFHMLQSLPTES